MLSMSKLELFPHQKYVLDKTKEYNRVGYFLDMWPIGLGKTLLSTHKMEQIGNRVNLIVVQASKMDDWLTHIKEEHTEYDVYNLRQPKQLEKFMKSNNLKVGIINYDLIWRREVLNTLKEFTLILDESTYIKTSTAKRTKFILKLKYNSVILLSGTVATKYEEILTQVKLLGWNISKKEFYRRYIITHRIEVGGFPIEIVVGYKNIDELKTKIRQHGGIFMKTEEVIELPDQIESNILVTNTKAYKDFKKNDYVDLGDTELIASNSLTKMLYERQLCGIYSKEKQLAFKEHIEGTNERVIVFYNFTEEYNILKGLTDKPISVVNGQKRDLESFENESNSITFIQYQAGSKGLNLQKANSIIYFTPTNSAENFMQSKKRTHRIGQKKTCFYYYMKVKGSIEEKIYDALERGEDYTNYLFEKDMM